MGGRIFNLAWDDQEYPIVLGLDRRGYPQIGVIVDGLEVTSELQKIS